jgi:predicted RNA-binding Zn ribbon-like protein
MQFAHDTELALTDAAALVNTDDPDDGDTLTTTEQLDRWLDEHQMSGSRRGTRAELDAVQALRPQLRRLWSTADRDEVAAMVNVLLEQSDARPYLSRHDQWDWHLHVTRSDAPVAHRLAAEFAMAFLDLVRGDDLGRLKQCAAEDCSAVLVDLSRNSSKRYCDTGNCGNRANVAAYRARKRVAG